MKVRQKKTLAILIMFLAAIIVSVFGAQSLAKYVFSFQQEAIGHYVDYRLHHDGDGKSAIVENIGSPQNYGSEYSYDHVGFITLKFDNFLEEDGTVNISQREISFTLRTPTQDELVDGKVTDAWQQDTPINPLSAYYEVSVVGEFGNELAVDSDEYKELTTFPEREKKSSYITLMIKRRTTSKKDDSEVPSLSGVEDISIIISTTLPYIDVEVFTISLTNRLMMISSTVSKPK